MVATSVYVIAAPLAVVRYPPMTDLPFHAAQTAVFRHYLDPAWHFREQFTLQPLAVPYMSMYALGALLMLVLSPVAAVKVAAAAMLALLPAGLAVLFHGLKRSPLLGVLGLGLVWCNLTHWGFLNHMGALGLFAMVVGLTLLLLDRPSRGRQIALALALVALFFTHIFRFPFALAAVVGTAVVVFPATRRLRPIALPLAPSLVLFAAWLLARTDTLRGEAVTFALRWARLGEIPSLLFTSFTDPAEAAAAGRAARLVLAALLLCAAGAAARLARVGVLAGPAPSPGSAGRQRTFARCAAVVPVACAAVFLGLFLSLPLEIGLWWYVYPREIVAALFLALGAFPDLPRSPWLRVPAVLALSAAAIGVASVVEDNYRRFDRSTRDFDALIARIPPAPRLLYLVFDHGGSTRTTTPFLHLPAWVQATRGGWLSFHFAVWDASPVAYRPRAEPGAVVPPPTPLRWEWTPQKFDVRRHGAFFDWFLVRRRAGADPLFARDPSIVPVDHVGDWWLYRRSGAP
ncbi:hypothetical protein SOCEGT47_059350 [Sorangium cellulosum]|uniref:Glycosyltransferase RgtA/B/C/D-like domain-containing protein n=1 Tax=Sorangium cellulosum TaxID=56 RepID=A0A4P2Q7E1_SORCE|nr:hypothetical protein [Sorangium cellulosum]AUX25390.1 hypothetical protein SOCEGT47_059350 [Sorangium cellulosum]